MRQQLKKIPGAVPVWHLLRRSLRATRYFLPRLVGHATYPVLGRRAPLRGYYTRTEDFLRHGGGHIVHLQPPSSIGGSAPGDPFQPEIFVASIPGARTLYDSGVVVSPDHRLLGDVSWEGWNQVSAPALHPAMFKFRLPPVKRIAGRVAVISSVRADNYYHWIFDILPRFGILERSGLDADYYVINASTQFQKDSLKVFNIPPDRILSPTAETHIQADQLVIPSLTGPVYELSPQLQACEYLRSVFLQNNATQKPHRAIYVTRADASNRRVINEDEVRQELTKRGFEIVSLTNLAFLEQVELFAQARIIVGPHGAGFTNVIFCQPGSVLIEFMPEKWQVNCFERLARLIGISYHSLVGLERGISRGEVPSHDHVVDVAELSRLLDRVLQPVGAGL